jgi:hypothetical protein
MPPLVSGRNDRFSFENWTSNSLQLETLSFIFEKSRFPRCPQDFVKYSQS